MITKIESCSQDGRVVGWVLTVAGDPQLLTIWRDQEDMPGIRAPVGKPFTPDRGKTLEYRTEYEAKLTPKPVLKCPACKKGRIKRKDVWYPDQPESRLKCPRCGQWGTLADWEMESEAQK